MSGPERRRARTRTAALIRLIDAARTVAKGALGRVVGRDNLLWRFSRSVYGFIERRVVSRRIRAAGRLSGLNERSGVNVIGYVNSEKGVGEAARSGIRALKAAGIPYSITNYEDPRSFNVESGYDGFRGGSSAVSLIYVNPHEMGRMFDTYGLSAFADTCNIGHWVWELSDFPGEFASHFRFLNEVWTPSRFVRDSVAAVSPVPVVRIPYSLPEDLQVVPGKSRADFGLPEDACVFLFAFDFSSSVERKNVRGLLQAFDGAFGGEEGVMLLLKTHHGPEHPREFEELRARIDGRNVSIMDGAMSRPEINTLMSLADCYVSLHRSEGFGLTIAEAMLLGKPVIATGYSGNADFMDDSNSFPVRYRIVPLERDDGAYRKGSVWAEPDTGHAAELMRTVRDDPEAAAARGARAREHVRRNLSPAAVGERIRRRLNAIGRGEAVEDD